MNCKKIQIEALIPEDQLEPMIHALAFLVNHHDRRTAEILHEGCIDLEDRDYLKLARPEIWGRVLEAAIGVVGDEAAEALGLTGLEPEEALAAYYAGISEIYLLEALQSRIEAGLPLPYQLGDDDNEGDGDGDGISKEKAPG